MISVIIPVYNEENTISAVLEKLTENKDIEIIVVDGESTDKTPEIVSRYPVTSISCKRKRSLQQNEGARTAKGEILLFLHADCRIEKEAFLEIEKSIDAGSVGGCLKHKIDSKRIIYRFIEKSGDIRARLFKVFYGDQGIFIRKDVFFELKGFDDVELFDDVLFSKKMKKAGPTVVCNSKITTTCRRWEKQGIIKTTVLNWFTSLGFIFRVSPDTLKRFYKDIR